MTVDDMIKHLQEFSKHGLGDTEVFKQSGMQSEDTLVRNISIVAGEKLKCSDTGEEFLFSHSLSNTEIKDSMKDLADIYLMLR